MKKAAGHSGHRTQFVIVPPARSGSAINRSLIPVSLRYLNQIAPLRSMDPDSRAPDGVSLPLPHARLASPCVPPTGLLPLAGFSSPLSAKHGVSEEDASYYSGRMKDGGAVVTVDGSAIDAERAREILYRNGGHNATQARAAAL